MALQRITLRDFVLVESLELELASGFSALTGETGAGKSILIEALQLVMGARADAGVVREGCARADISATFELPQAAKTLLDEYGMAADTDDENSLLLRRSIDNQGKSRGWINGIPATATQLRALGALLVDIYGQHAWQSLLQADTMRKLLDAYGRIDTHPLTALWQQWRQASAQLQSATQGQEQRQNECERLQWQIAEVSHLQPQADEWHSLNTEHQRLAHAKELIDAAEQSLLALDSDETGATSSLSRASHLLGAQRDIAPEFGQWADQIESCYAQLQDTVRHMHTSLARMELDPQRLELLDQRLAAWLTLARRFKLQPEDLHNAWQQWQQQLQALEATQDLAALQQAQDAAAKAYHACAAQISKQRKQAAQSLAQAVTAAMQDLGMQGGAFAVDLQATPQPTALGTDAVEFMVAGHAGSSLRPVGKVASGGELSRIALAIAVTTSQPGQTGTLIFDEVDAGIGGAVAHTVGKLMRQLGQGRQVLAVTHLPQVAACAHQHLQVRKIQQAASNSKAPVSTVQMLDATARQLEIARMLGGDTTSPTSLAHAAEMLAAAQ
ncbi:MAG: DNA repair protein RecN [Brachymonas sp.]|nr:DNA repair protein RecN [Brachymonas sp.]MBP6138360.1 DNA repair protein RecN [Brachymonas sp.]MBP6966218.1 DNA repair protein RecN [Brachymonas sp.]MBP7246972.1 DNA repair protein RecN [Brachymonas sp.]MBP7740177.1 DNA repair protein RecN [Brachymonas sp.]